MPQSILPATAVECSIQNALVDFLQVHSGHRSVSISGLRQAYAGASTENWMFDATFGDAAGGRRLPLILRRAPESDIVLVERESEFMMLRSLDRVGIPAPKAYWIDRDGRWFGRLAMVLERCPGTAARGVLADAAVDIGDRRGIAEQMADILAALHTADPQTLDLPSGLAHPRLATDLLDHYAVSVDRQSPLAIEIKIAASWLRDNLPPRPLRTALVHGDFRPANMLVDEARISAVLDWEFAHVGDPMEDIGWYLCDFYRKEHLIAGAWSVDDFLGRYERASGAEVDRKAARWWAVFAIFKLTWIVLSAVSAFRSGDTGRLVRNGDDYVGAMLRAVVDAENQP